MATGAGINDYKAFHSRKRNSSPGVNYLGVKARQRRNDEFRKLLLLAWLLNP
jgi:hypothetical protein